MAAYKKNNVLLTAKQIEFIESKSEDISVFAAQKILLNTYPHELEIMKAALSNLLNNISRILANRDLHKAIFEIEVIQIHALIHLYEGVLGENLIIKNIYVGQLLLENLYETKFYNLFEKLHEIFEGEEALMKLKFGKLISAVEMIEELED